MHLIFLRGANDVSHSNLSLTHTHTHTHVWKQNSLLQLNGIELPLSVGFLEEDSVPSLQGLSTTKQRMMIPSQHTRTAHMFIPQQG